MEIEVQNAKITVKAPALLRWIGVAAFFMALSGIQLLVWSFPLEPDYTPADIFGIVFICIWMAILFFLGGKAFQFGFKTVTIDENGVTSRWLRSEKTLTWAEIRDYGALYIGEIKGQGDAYTLYFANKEQFVKKNGRKKLKGQLIKTYLFGDSYAAAVQRLFPVCENHTELEPFIGDESRI